MNSRLNVCFDLGSDSLKACFGFIKGNEIQFGKIVEKSWIKPSFISSSAYYDVDTNKWLFGINIDKKEDPVCANFVKIKSLLSLLNTTGNTVIDKSNKEYFCNSHLFPKFIFPKIDNLFVNDDEFAERVSKDYVFEANCTPEMLCVEYFKFVKTIVDERFKEIIKEYGLDDIGDYSISLTFPQASSNAYIRELKEIIRIVFNKELMQSVSTTKALCYYAQENNFIKNGEQFLVFDIGDETISVTKANYYSKNTILLDGLDGHSLPLKIGGNNIDDAIAYYIEDTISGRETIGSPSSGSHGHIVEHGLFSNQFLFLKNVKDAKCTLSSPLADDPIYKDGVPLTLYRDVVVQRNFTNEEMADIIGTNGEKEGSIADEIVKYIENELALTTNEEVTKILIAGGVIETKGLLDYIKARIVTNPISGNAIEVMTFERNNNGDSELDIGECEDSSYSSAMGGNVIVLRDIDIKLCLSLSYGTYFSESGNRVLKMFVSKGTVLKNGENEFGASFACSVGVDDQMYSLSFSEKDILDHKRDDALDYSYLGNLIIGESGSIQRNACMKIAGLKIVSGDEKNSRIVFTYLGDEILAADGRIQIKEGIRVNSEGNAKVFIRLDENSYKRIDIRTNRYGYRRVDCKDIDVRFEGLGSFNVQKS